jgi:molybdopterin converting factor small subunit
LREKLGCFEEVLVLPEPVRVEDIRVTVERLYGLENNFLLLAVNGAFVEDKRIVIESDEIAIFPPVSGG